MKYFYFHLFHRLRKNLSPSHLFPIRILFIRSIFCIPYNILLNKIENNYDNHYFIAGGFSSKAPPIKRKAFTRAFLSAIYQSEIIETKRSLAEKKEQLLLSRPLIKNDKISIFDIFFRKKNPWCDVKMSLHWSMIRDDVLLSSVFTRQHSETEWGPCGAVRDFFSYLLFCWTEQCCAVLCSAVLYGSAPYCTVLYCTVLYYTVLCCTVRHCAVRCGVQCAIPDGW